MPTKPLGDVKHGDYFKLSENSRVYVRGEYVRSVRRYSCHPFDDVNRERFIPGKKAVFTDFKF